MVFLIVINSTSIVLAQEEVNQNDADNGTVEYVGSGPYAGSITGTFSVLSPGAQRYKLKYQKQLAAGGGFVDLPDAIEVPFSTDSSSGTFPINIALTVETGDQIKPLVENIDG